MKKKVLAKKVVKPSVKKVNFNAKKFNFNSFEAAKKHRTVTKAITKAEVDLYNKDVAAWYKLYAKQPTPGKGLIETAMEVPKTYTPTFMFEQVGDKFYLLLDHHMYTNPVGEADRLQINTPRFETHRFFGSKIFYVHEPQKAKKKK